MTSEDFRMTSFYVFFFYEVYPNMTGGKMAFCDVRVFRRIRLCMHYMFLRGWVSEVWLVYMPCRTRACGRVPTAAIETPSAPRMRVRSFLCSFIEGPIIQYNIFHHEDGSIGTLINLTYQLSLGIWAPICTSTLICGGVGSSGVM